MVHIMAHVNLCDSSIHSKNILDNMFSKERAKILFFYGKLFNNMAGVGKLVRATLLAVKELLGYLPQSSDTVSSALYIFLHTKDGEKYNGVLDDFILLGNKVHSPTVTMIYAMSVNTSAYKYLKSNSIKDLSSKIKRELIKILKTNHPKEEDIIELAVKVYNSKSN